VRHRSTILRSKRKPVLIMRKNRSRSMAALFLTLVLLCSAVVAHDLPMNSIMNAFVRVEPKQMDLVVRVPLDLLRGVPFPVKDSQYDVGASGTASQLALVLLEDGFVLSGDGVRLTPSSSSGRLSPPTDRSFESYESAAALADRPPDPSTRISYDKGSFDVHFTYPISSPKSVFKIQSQVAADLGSGAMLTVRYLPVDGSSRALIINSGAEPAALNPAWYHAAGGFIVLGIDHILTGIDHLLFLFCLVIPFRRLRGLISVITAFTLAHSITLFASAFHLAPQGAWFPPFVEMAIAASIAYTAIENIAGANLRRRWLVAGMFGLVHGFGFSNALGQSLQFAGSHLLLSLLSFNIGIEIGQLAVLAIMLPGLVLFRRLVPERTGIVILSAVVAVVGCYWIVERWQVLRQVQWPRLDADAVFGAVGWAAVVLIVFAAAWVLSKWAAHKSHRRVKALEGAGRVERAP
jgi:HupE / UreJ protein